MPGRPHPSPATDAAAALLTALHAHGVRDVVVSPGSRSQALALAAAAGERQGLLRVHVRIDERVAGFTALGLARETGVPAAVVCTSGTAVPNLLPAAVEAHHSGVPLLLLTADRPPELRGVGANQTTVQPGLFDPFSRLSLDVPVPEDTDDIGDAPQTDALRAIAGEAWLQSLGVDGTRPGPVHLNLPSREPLSGTLPAWAFAAAAAEDDPEPLPLGEELLLPRGPRTLVLAGAEAGEDAEALAHEGGWPLVAEIVSGARYGRRVVHGYRELLADPALGGRVQRVVLFGRPTLSREAVALLSRREVEVVAVRGRAEPVDLNGATRQVGGVRVAPGEDDPSWSAAWAAASRERTVDLAPPAPDAAGLASADPRTRLGAIDAELAAVRTRLDRETLVDAVWRATWPHDRLVFGSSRLVRVADRVLPGKRVPVHANRGVAGIDGTIATATGIALASQAEGRPGVTRVLLGDLALLHDVGALQLPPQEPEPRLQVVVGNDGGGTIFDGLEGAATASEADVDRVFYTPHSVRIEQLALAYGWEYQRVTTRVALDQALTSPRGGRQLIEVPLPR